MEGNKTHNNDNYQNGSSGNAGPLLSVREVIPCPPASVGTTADGQGVIDVSEGVCSSLDRDKSMALPVTRHPSTPTVGEFQFLLSDVYPMILKQYGYTGREFSNPTNTLPEKDEQDHDVLRVVESGRESAHERGQYNFNSSEERDFYYSQLEALKEEVVRSWDKMELLAHDAWKSGGNMMTSNSESELLTVEQFAQRFQVSRTTIFGWLKNVTSGKVFIISASAGFSAFAGPFP